jgi:hypothetical protein
MIIDLLLTQDLQSSRSSSCSTAAPRKGWRRSTSQNCISVRCFIFHNLATSEDRGMQICISMLKCNKIMESKAPNLECLLQTLASLWDALSPSWTSQCPWEVKGGTQSTSRRWRKMIASWCVDSRVCGLSPIVTSRPELNRLAEDKEVQVNRDASCWELTHGDFTADRPNLTELIDQIWPSQTHLTLHSLVCLSTVVTA